MKTALAFWWGTTAPAALRSTYQRPGAINWTRISLLFALGVVLAGNLAVPLVAGAQNLGTSPQFGQAVQGQQATTVEGTYKEIGDFLGHRGSSAAGIYAKVNLTMLRQVADFTLEGLL